MRVPYYVAYPDIAIPYYQQYSFQGVSEDNIGVGYVGGTYHEGIRFDSGEYNRPFSREQLGSEDLTTNRHAEKWDYPETTEGKISLIRGDLAGKPTAVCEGNMWGWSGVQGNLPLHQFPTFPTALSTSCLERLIKKLRDRETDVETLPMIGELEKTLRMIRNVKRDLLHNFGKIIRAWKPPRLPKNFRDPSWRGKPLPKPVFDRISDALEALGSLYLGNEFGWKPLIHDLETLTGVLNGSVPHKSSSVVVAGAKARERIVGRSNNFYCYPGAPMTESFIVWQFAYDFKCRYAAFHEAPTAGIIDQIGFRNFVPSIWELTPYSWLADYFANIGDFLDSISLNGNIAWSYKTEVTTATLTASLLPTPQISPRESSGHGGQYRITGKRIVRTRNPSLIPSIHFRVPGWGSRKWLNAGAFAAQNMQATRKLFR